MENEPDVPFELQPCQVACPYIEMHPDLTPPEDCTGPSMLPSSTRGNVLFCWLIRQEISAAGEVIVTKLSPEVEAIRQVDPERWQQLHDEYLDTLIEAEVFKIKLVANREYSQADADYVQHRSVAQIMKDVGINAQTEEGTEVYSRFEYLTALKAGFEYYPNVEPFKRGAMIWEDALRQYFLLRYPRLKGIASAMLRKEIEQRLFDQLDE